MKKTLKTTILATLTLCSTALYAQDFDTQMRQSVNKHLNNNDCEKAKKAYDAWGKTDAELARRVANCGKTTTSTPATKQTNNTTTEQANKGYIELPAAKIAVQTEDIVPSPITYGSAVTYCKNSSIGGFSDWRLPDEDELTKLFLDRKTIGNFQSNKKPNVNKSTQYWGTTSASLYPGFVHGYFFGTEAEKANYERKQAEEKKQREEQQAKYEKEGAKKPTLDFSDGNIIEEISNNGQKLRCRCVRTLP